MADGTTGANDMTDGHAFMLETSLRGIDGLLRRLIKLGDMILAFLIFFLVTSGVILFIVSNTEGG